MRSFSRTALLASAIALGTWTLGMAAQGAQLQNPMKATPESIAAGKKVFDSQCTACHGATAKGDGKMAAELNPKPADLTSGMFKHGSTDGELYTLIRDGSKGTGMKGFGSKLTADQLWNVVNYVRSLSAAKSR
jgi:mono/diheme cytochrome c family protein